MILLPIALLFDFFKIRLKLNLNDLLLHLPGSHVGLLFSQPQLVLVLHTRLLKFMHLGLQILIPLLTLTPLMHSLLSPTPLYPWL